MFREFCYLFGPVGTFLVLFCGWIVLCEVVATLDRWFTKLFVYLSKRRL